ncbi:epoxide hydrolase [Apiospora aurea]|uniref:Epoxide hydrolase n=1 Tax=Apiospora aurea TaxID=335848 RepID=A0ABR1QY49_9PEZI
MAAPKQAYSTADALVPGDPRVQHLDAQIGPYTYHYMLATPPGPDAPRATILLVHGWPDLGMAWRYQVPYLAEKLRCRVIVPDMLGYGRTSAPADPAAYTLRNIATQMRALVAHVLGTDKETVILGGHDWGGAAVWRIAMWCPDLVRAVFSLNVPFSPPLRRLVEGEELAKRVPSFRYQLQLASPETERIVDASPARLRAFINAIYGGTVVSGGGGRGPPNKKSKFKFAFSTQTGVVESALDAGVGPASLMSPGMVDFYVREYGRHGLHGPTNWYRTRRRNFEDELPRFVPRGQGGGAEEGEWRCKCPAMVVMAEKDITLPPALADGTERWFEGPGGLRKEVVQGVGHWGMWQDPETVNGYIGSFVEDVLGGQLKGKL